MISLRKSQNLPHLSFDLDGDGVVGAHDLVLASQFDKDRDGKLNQDERQQAIRALSQGFSQNFVWGCESSGLNRSFRLVQKRGKVINDEDFGRIRETYPEIPHPNSLTWTKTLLEEQRKSQDRAEAKKNEGRIYTVTKKELKIDNFLSKENYVESPQYHSITGKRDLEKKVAREKVGLTTEPRDLKEPEVRFEYTQDPKNLSLTDMKTKYRENLVSTLNNSADFSHVTFYEKIEKEKNFAAKKGRNLGDVVNERRKKDIEHLEGTFNQTVLGIHGKELPKFEENLRLYENIKSAPVEAIQGVRREGARTEVKTQKIPMKPTEVVFEVGNHSSVNMINSKFSDYYSQFMPFTGKINENIQEQLRLAQVKLSEKKQFRFLSHNEITPPITQRLLLKSNSPNSRFKNITSTGFTFR